MITGKLDGHIQKNETVMIIYHTQKFIQNKNLKTWSHKKKKTLGCKHVEIGLEDDFLHLLPERKVIKEKKEKNSK